MSGEGRGKKILTWKQSRIFGKETEQQARHKYVERVNSLRVANIVISANIIKKFSHQLGGFYISLRFSSVLNLLYTGKRCEELKIFP